MLPVAGNRVAFCGPLAADWLSARGVPAATACCQAPPARLGAELQAWEPGAGRAQSREDRLCRSSLSGLTAWPVDLCVPDGSLGSGRRAAGLAAGCSSEPEACGSRTQSEGVVSSTLGACIEKAYIDPESSLDFRLPLRLGSGLGLVRPVRKAPRGQRFPLWDMGRAPSLASRYPWGGSILEDPPQGKTRFSGKKASQRQNEPPGIRQRVERVERGFLARAEYDFSGCNNPHSPWGGFKLAICGEEEKVARAAGPPCPDRNEVVGGTSPVETAPGKALTSGPPFGRAEREESDRL
ncbi:hypothetical protein MG293_010207 [Ovis ammon polii]|uniref:Uncharacterized protein n=1 Tax=Ovis ammon polii TaxID=230172 RepID=A0AAD4U7S7_OVIAM|nr:hypothetical protein MG293_010207 [Ovis ammon polii]